MDNGQRTIVSSIIHFPLSVVSFLDGRFLNDHHRDVVLDRIDEGAVVIYAFQATPAGLEFDPRFTFRAA